jgi:hypothetical protein
MITNYTVLQKVPQGVNEYLQRRLPTFDEWFEDGIEDQLLEAYNLERMDRKERWEQEQLNEFEELSVR